MNPRIRHWLLALGTVAVWVGIVHALEIVGPPEPPLVRMAENVGYLSLQP